MSKVKFLAGAVVGAVAGVVAGLLTAPKSGKETRADLKEKAEELKAQTSKKAGQVKKQADVVAKDVMGTVSDYKHRAERAVNSATAELKDGNKK